MVMLKILHARLQRYVYQELPDVHLGFKKEEKLEFKLPKFAGLYRKQGNFRKTSISVSSTTLKPLTVWVVTNCGKLLEKWAYQTTLPVLRNMCAGQEAAVRTLYGTTDWFKIEKGV